MGFTVHWGTFCRFGQVCVCACACACALSHVQLCDPMDCSLSASFVHEIIPQGFWSVLLFPHPGGLPSPGIEPASPVASALAGSLRGQGPESESLSRLCLLSMWIEALLGTMRFLRTHIRNCRICSDWKYGGLLPLAVVTVSGSEEAL